MLGHCSGSISLNKERLFDWEEGIKFVSRHYPVGCTIVGCYYGNTYNGEELVTIKNKLKDSLIRGHDISVQVSGWDHMTIT